MRKVGDTPFTGYGYDTSTTTAVSGVTTATYGYRPTTVQYPATNAAPDSRVLTYSYDTGTDDAVNRLGSIYDGTGTAASPTIGSELASYNYLGPDTIVTEDYTQPKIGLDYTGGGDSYSGLDQFNRVVDQVWAGYDSNSSAGVLDEYKYGYNAQGEVAYRQNVTAGSKDLDEAYTYDQLAQLQSLTRGQLDTATDLILTSTEDFTQNWALDGMGNWSEFKEGTSAENLTLDQQRTPTADNEIGTITNTVGNGWAQPTYDADGNMTTTPPPVDQTDGLHCTYDAWNRLVNITDHDPGSINVSYTYDGLGRMITRTDNNAPVGSVATTDYYYAGQQMLESDQRAPASLSEGATRTTQQFVWSALYVDSPIQSQATTYSYSSANGGSWAPGLPTTLYYLTDANNNVTAVTNAFGVVQERYSYDAFGNVTMYDGPTSVGGDWSNPHTVSTQGTTRLFAGEQQDPTTGLYYDRARWYNPSTGGFLSQDPAQSDPNLYRYAGNDPIEGNDPSGMDQSGEGTPPTGSSQVPAAPPPEGPTPTCAQNPVPASTGAVPTGDSTAASRSNAPATGGDALSAFEAECRKWHEEDDARCKKIDQMMQHYSQSVDAYGAKLDAISGQIHTFSNEADFGDLYLSYLNPFTAPKSVDSLDSAAKVGQGTGWVMTAVGLAGVATVEALGVGAISVSEAWGTGWAWVTGAGAAAAEARALRSNADCEMSLPRARHHTSLDGLQGIQSDMAINPARGEPAGVHVETEPFGTPKPGLGGPMAQTGAAGEGAYVEMDMPGNAQPTNVGPRNTAVIPTSDPLPLEGLNPTFVPVRAWWNLWYFWR